MSTIIAIDPGPRQSACLQVVDGVIVSAALLPNAVVRDRLESDITLPKHNPSLVIEGMVNFGNNVGRDVYHTCYWIGIFGKAWGGEWGLMLRPKIKLHLCHTNRCGNPAVRTALLDLYGGKGDAIGKKATPGPLYKVKGHGGHMWSAMAIYETFKDCGYHIKGEDI